MNISRIEIKNFKSFENVNVDLNDFNVLVGAHASGKSNFVEAFQFLKDVSEDFEKGINAHGGPFFQNLNLKSDTPSCIKVTLGNDDSVITRINPDSDFKIQYNSIEYELCINFKDNSQELINESVNFNFNICRDDEKIHENTLMLTNKDWRVTAGFEHEPEHVDLEYFVPKSLLNIVNDNLSEKHELIINTPLSAVPISWTNYFKSINYYDFDPKFCRLDDGAGNAKLTELGQNLPLVLEQILNDAEKQRRYMNLVSILLPYIEKIDVISLEDNRRMFRLSEKYNRLPVLSPFVSDGTMNILALISALYFESGDIILIEGPERNIHPALFIQLVGMMREVSQSKQIIITTHSPEILNYCDLEDIHLISRQDDGFSKVSKPVDNMEVKVFIDELGIGQVFVDDYLEFGNE